MNPHFTARLRIGVVIFVAILIQTTLVPDLRLYRVAPDLMVLVVVAAAMVGGTEAGAWVGFFAGLTSDMFLTSTPVGLSALTYCLVGAAIGALRASVLQDHRILLPVAAFVGTAVSVVVFVGAGDMLGQGQLLAEGRSWLIRVALVEACWGAVLAIPVGFVYSWAARGSAGVDRLGGLGRSAAVRDDRLAA